MAAYAALASLMHLIHQIEDHPSPPISLDRQQVQSLTEKVTFLQRFLEGYSSPAAGIDTADPLEIRIADSAYAVEDVIESHIVDVINLDSNHDQESDPREETKCREEVSCVDFYQDLHQVIEEMRLIKELAMKIDADEAAIRVSASSVASLTPSSTGQNTTMVCCDDVLLEIMDQLTADRPDRQVIPIVGMGGIGKTTLAITVYSKTLIKERFDICAWATISQKYDTREILCELLSQATSKKKEELGERSEDKLGSELYRYLFGRRFLIVMDDMWGIDVWDKVQRFFPNNGNGSRILVTTRLSQLSSQLNNNYSLQMKFLDEVGSWDLFSRTVFGEESCPLELKEIGKKIVENCRGLPLSIVVVGGLLKKMERTQKCWESIRKNFASTVNLENDKHCLRLLKMSYNHLPVYLKPCFLYMGVFEEDRAIHVSTLIKLWVSEGFLKPSNEESLEIVAEGFLKDLVDRNLILIDQLGSTRNIKYCKIHDLLRYLCLRESEKCGFYQVIGQCSREGIHSQRRIVIPRSTSTGKVLNDLQSTSHTRSVICENEYGPPCRKLGLLRILHAYENHANQSYVNALVFQCVNLRHLVVKVGSMSPFLSSLNLLWNLHTLIVYCFSECNAPVGIWKMPQFRHIEFIIRCLSLPDPPCDGQDDAIVMENLMILKGVENFKCGEEVVKRIPNVKKLRIRYCGSEGMEHDDYYCLSNIKHLCQLESLCVSHDYNFRKVASLRKLTLPHSLKSLSLEMRGDFEWEDMLGKIGLLPLLQKLVLFRGCFGTGEWEIVEGGFPRLVYLSLSWCGGLKHWATRESSVFPRLEQLRLQQLKELEEIPSEIGNIPTLQKIWLIDCSEAAVMSAKYIVEEQVELQGDQLPFHVEVRIRNNEALRSWAGPNFEVKEYSKSEIGHINSPCYIRLHTS